MKKLVFVVGIFLCIMLLMPGLARAQGGLSLGLKLAGGINFLGGGDINDGTKGQYDFWASFWGNSGYPGTGAFNAAHLGMNFSGEFILQFAPNIGVGIGAEYLQASSDTTFTVSDGMTSIDFYWRPKISAIPITATLYYSMPVGTSLNVVFHGGLGYCMAKLLYNSQIAFLSLNTSSIDASKGGIEFHGGVGLDYAVAANIAVFAELRVRYAPISGFEGTETYDSTTEDGTLYFFRQDHWTFGAFPSLYFGDTEPSGSGIFDVREAEVDFNGISFRLGLKINF